MLVSIDAIGGRRQNQTWKEERRTGSTNTWLLYKNTDIGGATKEFSYDDTKSKTAKKLEQRAAI